MSKKTANAKGAKGKPKSKAIVTLEAARKSAASAEAMILDRVGKRRSFGAMERLPDEVRAGVRERMTDPRFAYRDMQDYVLLETTPTELREEAKRRLAEAHQRVFGKPWTGESGGGSGGLRAEGVKQPRGAAATKNRAYEAERRRVHAWAKGESDRLALDAPVYVSDDSISREYARVMQTSIELQRAAHQFVAVAQELGDTGLLSIGKATAAQVLLKAHNAVSGAKTAKDLKKIEGFLQQSSRWFTGVVQLMKLENNDRRRMIVLQDRLIDAVSRRLKHKPDLANKFAEIVREAAKEASS